MTPEKQAAAIAYLQDEIRSLRLAPTINGCDMKPEWAEQLEIMETCLEAVKAYPPARIDREAWEPCEFCERFNFNLARTETDKYGARILLAGGVSAFPSNVTFKHCPECGRPLTPEAWDILEKRLRG